MSRRGRTTAALAVAVLVTSAALVTSVHPHAAPVTTAATAAAAPVSMSVMTPTRVGQSATLRAAGPLDSSLTRPVVVTNPRGVRTNAGATVRFVARATGHPAPRVQWYREVHGRHRFDAIAGARHPVLVLRRVSAQLSGDLYRAVFTNRLGRQTSHVARLVVVAATPPAPATTTTTTTTPPTPVTVAVPPPTLPVDVVTPVALPTTTPTTPVTTVSTPTTTPPLVTLNPQSASVSTGTNATFVAAANGTPSPSVAWQYSLDAGATYSPVTGATSDTLVVSTTISMSGRLYRAVFTNSAGTATTTPAVLSVAAAPFVATTNWAGYVATPGTYSHATGTFSVPVANCTSATTYASIWVGIDGFSPSQTVEQDGVMVECNAGVASYNAWYEMYGDTNVNCNCSNSVFLNSAYPVAPGDVITAVVDDTNSTWTLSLVDATANWHFEVSITGATPTPAQSSAEWILEAPTICSNSQCSTSSTASLAPTAPVIFTQAGATSSTATGSIIDFPDVGLTLNSASSPTVSPGPLSPDGTSFSV
ncbi:MAG: hypothetical protein KGJ47_00205 [Acidobacteriota bacterium]|nr:hypothetical protein [Acidobacteriota bacterium]